MIQEELSFKDISYRELCWPPYPVEQNFLDNFGIGHHEEHFFEIIMSLDLWFRR